jgi:hypothetical protein
MLEKTKSRERHVVLSMTTYTLYTHLELVRLSTERNRTLLEHLFDVSRWVWHVDGNNDVGYTNVLSTNTWALAGTGEFRITCGLFSAAITTNDTPFDHVFLVHTND